MAGENELVPGTLIESGKLDENFDGGYSGDFDETENSLRTFRDESILDHVVTGMTIATSVDLDSTITAGVAVIGGRRRATSSTPKSFTASKDTYVDLKADGTFRYTEVTNNNASPALGAGEMRIAIVITDADNITAVNQGDPQTTGPTVSSAILAVCDSLGNVIYPTDPTGGLIGYREITSDFTTATTGADVDVTGLSCPVNIPAGRRVKVQVWTDRIFSSGAAGGGVFLRLKESTTVLANAAFTVPVSTYAEHLEVTRHLKPSAGVHTYKAAVQQSAGNLTLEAGTGTDGRAFIAVELE